MPQIQKGRNGKIAMKPYQSMTKTQQSKHQVCSSISGIRHLGLHHLGSSGFGSSPSCPSTYSKSTVNIVSPLSWFFSMPTDFPQCTFPTSCVSIATWTSPSQLYTMVSWPHCRESNPATHFWPQQPSETLVQDSMAL